MTEPPRGDDQGICGTSFRPHPGTLGLNDRNPWPGLDSYDEASAHFFHGRDGEAIELLRLVRLAPLTAHRFLGCRAMSFEADRRPFSEGACSCGSRVPRTRQ